MSIYESFGVTPLVNLWGTATQLGGSIMAPEVIDAMREASLACARPDELQAAASRFLTKLSGAEAGYISCGANSGMMLCAAACLARNDLKRIEALPDTSNMPNEFLIAIDQRSGWDNAIRAAGGKLVCVGFNEAAIGSIRGVELWDYEAAITPQTVAISYCAYTWDSAKEAAVTKLAELAHKHGILLIVDAAASVPPMENFKRIVGTGVDLASFSGGKAILGPQNAGMIIGRKDLIASIALQHLDMVGLHTGWNPPEDLIPRGFVPNQPRQGIGRGMKVSKETLIALLCRLRTIAEKGIDHELAAMDEKLDRLEAALKDCKHITIARKNPVAKKSGSAPTMDITVDAAGLGKSALDVCLALTKGTPRIYVGEKNVPKGVMSISAMSLPEAMVEPVAKRLREVFGG